MGNIVVLIKQVPDYEDRKLADDHTLDRAGSDAVLDEINERAVEEALQIKEANGGEVTILTAGPERATEAIRKALSMGADKAIHIKDDALHGSDAVQTAYVLARALGTVEGVELVIASDVDNPLLGLRGATNVYGPQKGVTEERKHHIDAQLERFAALTDEHRHATRALEAELAADAADDDGWAPEAWRRVDALLTTLGV